LGGKVAYIQDGGDDFVEIHKQLPFIS
jgi:hypothetical protein